MIKHLLIENYKSIQHIETDVRRVNVFIGEHNSGKSNILEALTWFSVNALKADIFPELFRFKTASNFFFDFDTSRKITVAAGGFHFTLAFGKNDDGSFSNSFRGNFTNLGSVAIKEVVQKFSLDISSNRINPENSLLNSPFRTYQFKKIKQFYNTYIPFLNPPFGDNIPGLLQSSREWKQMASDFFRDKGFRLLLKPTENDIEMAKEVEDELYSFPYATISETMQRYVFLMLALETNKDAVLILDEPEANMYPLFVKDFAERVADDANQFFLSTHNPYLLQSIMEKTPRADIAVFITRMNKFSTEVQPCSDKEIDELISLGSGSFFNLENL